MKIKIIFFLFIFFIVEVNCFAKNNFQGNWQYNFDNKSKDKRVEYSGILNIFDCQKKKCSFKINTAVVYVYKDYDFYECNISGELEIMGKNEAIITTNNYDYIKKKNIKCDNKLLMSKSKHILHFFLLTN